MEKVSGFKVKPAPNFFQGLSSQDNSAELSSAVKNLALVLMKISNDLRLMNSGPLTGLSDIELEALQPGSSIMPGKVNPVIPRQYQWLVLTLLVMMYLFHLQCKVEISN